MFALLAICLSIGGIYLTEATFSPLVLHERRSDILVQQWTQGHRLDASIVLPVRIGLMQNNLENGHQILMDISNPKSSSYGKHLSAEEVINLFAPKNETITVATDWLTSSGIEHARLALSPNKQWIKFDASVNELEKLLDAKYHVYQHQASFENDIACEDYSVPQHVQEYIDYISPGIGLRSFKKPKRLHRREATEQITRLNEKADDPTGLKNCSHSVKPKCIAAMYNISQATTAIKGNEIGFYEGFNDVYSQKDFDLFTKDLYPRIPQGFAPTMLSIDGASVKYTRPPDADTETAIDTQAAMPIIYPQGFKVWQTSIKGPNDQIGKGWFNTWLDAIDGSYCNYTAFNITGDSPGIDPNYPNKRWPNPEQCGVYKPTNVMSISYGGAEASLPVAYVKRQCNEYMKLGIQGVSVFMCSQDEGVGSFGANGTTKVCLGPKDDIFAPTFPASCPYVTSVGATTYPAGADVRDHSQEKGVGLSGGGFSNVWPMPDYQKSAVENYLTKHTPPYKSYSTVNGENIGQNGGLYNRNGRGIPDIAAIGNWYKVVAVGILGTGAGTSFATPLWAALFNRINEERLAMNKSTVGFVNPALYANPYLMHDIQKGYNWNCDLKPIGFNTSKGWDPVTGLGSPSYPALLEHFKSL